MHTSKTIIFFGTDHFSVSALRHLIEAGYTIAAVITKPDSRSGRGQKLVAPAVKTLALQHGIPVWQPTKVGDIHDDLRMLGNDLVGILSSFGRIIPQSIIDLFTPGILNIHPSLLPQYRGPSPIETAIINGDVETGVSLMLLTAEMDAGPVYDQRTYPLDGSETQDSLYDTLAELGSRLLLHHLPVILDGTQQPVEQKGDATYSHLLQKTDATVDPDNDTALFIERHVRAYQHFPKTKLLIGADLVIPTRVHVGKATEKELAVPCSEGMLIIDQLIAPNGKTMSGSDFVRGYRR